MNKHTLKRSFARLAIGVGALVVPFSAHAAANTTVAPTPPAHATSSALDECSKELLLSYFPKTFVNNSLKKFNIPEDKWAGINNSLASKDKEIVKMVEQKAAAMNPNPLKDPQHRQEAVKLFRDTLLEVFTGALKENGVQETDKFQAILDDIQQQKAKKFAECMEKHKAQLDRNSEDASDNTSNNNNDDDDDDDDNDSTATNASKSGNAASKINASTKKTQ